MVSARARISSGDWVIVAVPVVPQAVHAAANAKMLAVFAKFILFTLTNYCLIVLENDRKAAESQEIVYIINW